MKNRRNIKTAGIFITKKQKQKNKVYIVIKMIFINWQIKTKKVISFIQLFTTCDKLEMTRKMPRPHNSLCCYTINYSPILKVELLILPLPTLNYSIYLSFNNQLLESKTLLSTIWHGTKYSPHHFKIVFRIKYFFLMKSNICFLLLFYYSHHKYVKATSYFSKLAVLCLW